MAEKVGLVATLDMSDFNRGFAQYMSSLDDMNRKTTSAVGSLGTGFVSLGDGILKTAGILSGAFVVAATAATIALGKFVSTGIKGAIEMEAQIDTIVAIMGEGDEATAQLQQTIQDLGVNPNLKVSASEAAQAIELLARNGVGLKDILGGAAEASILLANATGADFGRAADIATDAMAIFDLKAEDMLGAVSDITAVTTNSKFTIEDYATALRNGGAQAAAAGIDLAEFNTAITVLAEELGDGSSAGTGFRNFLTRLTPTAGAATDTMRELGLITADGTNQFYDANGQLKSMSEIVKVLDSAFNGTESQMVLVSHRTAEQNAALADLRNEYNKITADISSYTIGVKGAGLSEDERSSKVNDLNERLGELDAAMQPLIDVKSDMVAVNRELTDMEKQVALETLFGARSSNVALGLMKEAAPVYESVEEAVRELGVSHQEAALIVESGMTKWDAMQAKIEGFDVAEMAARRMNNLAGTIEILQGVIESIALDIGFQFIPALRMLGEAALSFIDNNKEPLLAMFKQLGEELTNFVNVFPSLLGYFRAVAQDGDYLNDFLADMPSHWQDSVKAVGEFISIIVEFVNTHAVALRGAIKGISSLFAGSALTSSILIIGRLLLGLMNPITFLITAAGLLGAAWETNFGNIQGIVAEVIGYFQQLQAIFQGEGFSGLAEKIGADLQTLWVTIGTLITEQSSEIDWASVGQTIITKILEGFQMVGEGLGTALGNLIILITEWLNEQDWTVVGEQTMTAIGEGFVLGIQILAFQLQKLVTFIGAFLSSQDWPTVLVNMFTAIYTALQGFGEGALPVLATWFQVFWTWVTTTDWLTLFSGIVTKVQEALATFAENVGPTLSGWWQTFLDWVEVQDWEGLGTLAVNAILDGLKLLFVDSQLVLLEWWGVLFTWFGEADWASMTELAIKGFIAQLKGVAGLALVIISTFPKFYEDVKQWFIDQDWGAMGQAIIDGLLQAIEDGMFAVVSAIVGIGRGAITAFGEEIGARSPATEFITQGEYIIAGIKKGLVDNSSGVLSTIKDLGSKLSSVFGSVLSFGQNNSKLAELNSELENLSLDPTMDMQGYIANETKRLEILQQIKAEEESIARLKEQQQSFQFLTDQLSLIEQIGSLGLDANKLFAGITFGLDADASLIFERAAEGLNSYFTEHFGSPDLTSAAQMNPLTMMGMGNSAYSYSTSNNYNLAMNTQQSSGNVVQDFRVMELLRG